MNTTQSSEILIIVPTQKEGLKPSGQLAHHFNHVMDKFGFSSYVLEDESILSQAKRCYTYGVILLVASQYFDWTEEQLQTLKEFKGQLLLEAPFASELLKALNLNEVNNTLKQPQLRLTATHSGLKQILENTFSEETAPSGSNVLSTPSTSDSLILSIPNYATTKTVNWKNKTSNQRAVQYRKLLEIYLHVFDRKYIATGRFGKALSNDLQVLLGLFDNQVSIKHFSEHLLDNISSQWPSTEIKLSEAMLHKALGNRLSEDMETLHFKKMARSEAEIGSAINKTLKQFETFLKKKNNILNELKNIFGLNSFSKEKSKRKAFNSITLNLLKDTYHATLLSSNNPELESVKNHLKHISEKNDHNPKKIINFLLAGDPDQCNQFTSYIVLGLLAHHFGLNTLANNCLETIDKVFQDPITLLYWKTPEKKQLQLTGWVLLYLGLCKKIYQIEDAPDPVYSQTLGKTSKFDDFISVHCVEHLEAYECLAEISPPNNKADAQAAILRSNQVTLFLFPAFSYLLTSYHFPTLPAPFMSVSQSQYPHRFEKLVKQCILDACLRADKPYPVIANWPNNAPFAVSIRRDVDRPTSNKLIKDLLELDNSLGLKSSWYWLRSNYNPSQIKMVTDAQQENAWHAERYLGEDSPQFLNELTPQALQKQMGVTIHGGISSDGWRGEKTLIVFNKHSVSYADAPGNLSLLPFYPIVSTGASLPVTIMPVSTAFEKDAQNTREHEVFKVLDLTQRNGGLFTLLHHPDLCFEAISNCMKMIASRNGLPMTLQEASDWWSKTHQQSQLKIDLFGNALDYELKIHAKNTINQLAIILHGLPLAMVKENPAYTIESVKEDNTEETIILKFQKLEAGVYRFMLFETSECQKVAAL